MPPKQQPRCLLISTALAVTLSSVSLPLVLSLLFKCAPSQWFDSQSQSQSHYRLS